MTPISETDACNEGELARDGACYPVGLPQNMACPPGEVPRADGGCDLAGVPPDGCGAGFVHDGARGCEPVFPDTPCSPGMIAVLGESICRELMPCGTGPWGDIPTDPTTVYVDAAYAGGANDGSMQRPFNTITEALTVAASDALIAVAAGSYAEALSVQQRPIRIWGRCPSMVEVVAPPAAPAALVVATAGAGSEVHGLALTGTDVGAIVAGALDVTFDSLWVHDCPARGIHVQDDLGPTHLTVTNTLVENVHDFGIAVAGGALALSSSQVRDVARGAIAGGFGVAINAVDAQPMLDIVQTAIMRIGEFGLYVWGGQVSVDSSLVREAGVDPSVAEHAGILARANAAVASTQLTVTSSIVELGGDGGIFSQGVELTVDRTVVRNQLGSFGFGRGVSIVDDPTTGQRPAAVLSASLIRNNVDAGVLIAGIDATFDGVALVDNAHFGAHVQHDDVNDVPTSADVRHSFFTCSQCSGLLSLDNATMAIDATRITASHGPELGDGTGLLINASQGFGSVVATASSFDGNQLANVLMQGGSLELVQSVVSGGVPNAVGQGGHGIHVQPHPISDATPTLALRQVLVENNQTLGVIATSGQASVIASIVRHTLPSVAGEFGDGVVVALESAPNTAAPRPSTVTIDASSIETSARAGVANFGGNVQLTNTWLTCHAFELANECYNAVCGAIADEGGNLCGCPEATDPCQAISSGIEPPAPL